MHERYTVFLGTLRAFVELATLKITSLVKIIFGNSWQKYSKGKAILVKIAKFGDFWSI